MIECHENNFSCLDGGSVVATKEILNITQVMYRPFFPTIYYCGIPPDAEGTETIERLSREGWNLNFLPMNTTRGWWWLTNYLCIGEVWRHHPKTETGYLFMADDVFMPPAHRETHLNREKNESNLSAPGIQRCHETPFLRALKRAST